MELTQQTLSLMKELTEASGIPGGEKNVTRILKQRYEETCDEVIYDALGSVYGVKRSHAEAPFRVMVSAHCDEVGLMVRAVRENGLLQFAAVGGVWETQLLSQRLRLETGDGRSYTGAMVADSPKQIGPTQETVLQYSLGDFGFSSADEAYQAGVLEGDMVTLQCPFTVLNGGKRLLAKAWDDRYGCILGVELLQLLKDIELPFDLYVGANAQEEVGLRGARTAAAMVRPDLAVVLDCTAANDVHGFQTPRGGLGQGVMVRFLDRTYIPNRALQLDFLKLLREQGIPYQWHQSMGGTDAGEINLAEKGVPVLTACICARGVHTSASVIDRDDYLNARTAVSRFLLGLDRGKLELYRQGNR